MISFYFFSLLTFGALFCCASPSINSYWSSPDQGVPWKWQTTSGLFFDEFIHGLDDMQTNYWNGSYWPTTIQWIGAFLDNLLAAAEISLVEALDHYDGQVPDSTRNREDISEHIRDYYEDIHAYYSNEDVVQIFGAAYDDAQWVVLEWLEVLRFLDEDKTLRTDADVKKYAHRAQVFYNRVQDQFNQSLCEGGVNWNPALAVYKNAITNELFLSSSMAMYFHFPGSSDLDPYPTPDYARSANKTLPPMPQLQQHDKLFLDNAIKEWNWFKSHNFTNEQGLVVDGFHISDGQTSCDQRNEMVYSYNQGVLLSGLRWLWEATGDASYLNEGYPFIDAVIKATGWDAPSASQANNWAGLGRNGILEDYCDAAANCSQDNLMFKGIYFHHLDLFCEPLPTAAASIPGVSHTASSDLASQHASRCNTYAAWVRHNARAALATRNETGLMGNWWGAPYVNETQAAAPQYATPCPSGSLDYRNDPAVLQKAVFQCYGAPECASLLRVLAKSSNNQRTVETQGGGVSVVKTASDLALRR